MAGPDDLAPRSLEFEYEVDGALDRRPHGFDETGVTGQELLDHQRITVRPRGELLEIVAQAASVGFVRRERVIGGPVDGRRPAQRAHRADDGARQQGLAGERGMYVIIHQLPADAAARAGIAECLLDIAQCGAARVSPICSKSPITIFGAPKMGLPLLVASGLKNNFIVFVSKLLLKSWNIWLK